MKSLNRHTLCWLIVVGAVLGFAGSAAAKTTIIAPAEAHRPYQRWIDEAKVPTPEMNLEAIETAAPCELVGAEGCTDKETKIEIVPSNWGMRFTFLHELGHVWDFQAMPEWQRQRFLALIRQPNLPWYLPRSSSFERVGGGEWFADAYALCAFRSAYPPHSYYEVGPGIMGSPALNATCRMIRR